LPVATAMLRRNQSGYSYNEFKIVSRVGGWERESRAIGRGQK
jgi:hypothetical protein